MIIDQSFTITWLGKKYAASDLLKAEHLAHAALLFCREWLLGQKVFTLSTSGSTGAPKNIEIHRSQMRASALATIKALGLVPHTKALVCINTDFIGGKMMLVRGMIGSWDMVLINPSSTPFEQFNDEDQFDFTALVPLQLHAIINKTPEKIHILNQMKSIIVGGGAVNKNLQNQLQKLKPSIYSTYGMTETVSHIALKCLNSEVETPYFKILDGVEISQDTRGCLVIRAEKISNNELITNDLVEIYSEKEFKWIGRIDHVINTGGVKVPLEQLEEKIAIFLKSRKLSIDFAVSYLSDSVLGQRIILVIEKKIDNNQQELLLKGLKKELGRYECPKEIRCVKKIPETNSGKIDRLQLAKTIKSS